ncbi:hypothetical protein [Pendulispora albinea]|uniref:DUF2946 domain-containing protein n=1 Tax=Pendulispora albinea TaxID=2741071 RepID=A0ABZ2LR36_9BACT
MGRNRGRETQRTRRQSALGSGLRALVATARLFACAVLVFAVLCGFAQAGQRYFFCAPMGLLVSNPCLHAAAVATEGRAVQDPARAELRAHHVDCCEVLTMPSVPNGAHIDGPSVPEAPLVALVSDLQGEQRCTADPLFGICHRLPRVVERWRVPLPSPSAQRARLMVFLT